MRLFIKISIFILIFQSLSAQTEEENVSDSRNRFQTFIGVSKSFALDENFIGDSYNLKYGAELGGAYLFTENIFAGLQFDVLWTNAEDIIASGGIKRTRIISSSINAGYILNLIESLDLSAKIGIGHGRYANDAVGSERNFHDDAFITYVEPKLTYSLDETFGVYLGFNYRYDKMSIETSEFYEEYFGSSARGSLNLGAHFSF